MVAPLWCVLSILFALAVTLGLYIYRENRQREVVLRLLERAGAQGMLGLEMVERSAGQVRRGMVYVTLSNLEQEGHVVAEEEPGSAYPLIPRRRYWLTGLVRVGRCRGCERRAPLEDEECPDCRH